MEPLDENYKGREHSFVKHQFLTEFLISAAYKNLNRPGVRSTSPVFNYVDGFAGPWAVGDTESCSDSSFDNALRVLTRVRDDLVKNGISRPVVRFFLCEKNNERFAQLDAYARRNSDVDIRAFRGAFEDHLDTIRAGCGSGFTFTFIDPTGWNLRSSDIAAFLAKVRGDFLLNFMSEPINRHAGYSGSQISFGRFLADPDWMSKLDWSAPERLEVRILNMLRRRLIDLGAASYLPHFAIHRTRENRVQMRLLLGTKHPMGVFVFRQVESKVEALQVEQRRIAKQEGSRVQSLFSDDQLNALELQRDGVGSAPNLARAKAFLEKHITARQNGIQFKFAAADCMAAVPVRETHVKDLLAQLRDEGKITFTLKATKRKLDMEDWVYPALA